MSKIKHLVAAVSCAALAACLVALPAEGGSGRGTLYSVTSLGGSPATYRLSVNSTSGVTVGDHVMAKVSGGGSGVWEVTAKTASTVTVEDSLTEQNGSAFGAPVAGGADSVWAYSTPTATGLTIIPDGAQHWAAALRRNTYLQAVFATYLEGAELAADADAPSANGARIYVRDNGSGKTQLVVRFNSGAVQVIATEP